MASRGIASRPRAAARPSLGRRFPVPTASPGVRLSKHARCGDKLPLFPEARRGHPRIPTLPGLGRPPAAPRPRHRPFPGRLTPPARAATTAARANCRATALSATAAKPRAAPPTPGRGRGRHTGRGAGGGNGGGEACPSLAASRAAL